MSIAAAARASAALTGKRKRGNKTAAAGGGVLALDFDEGDLAGLKPRQQDKRDRRSIEEIQNVRARMDACVSIALNAAH
jgi:hypothetical protein